MANACSGEQDSDLERKLKDVIELRCRIYDMMADNLSDEKIRQIQKSIGVWPLANKTPVPSRGQIVILADMGTMSFSVDLAGHQVKFGFFQRGKETRFGALIPKELLDLDRTHLMAKIASCVDGKPCPRMDDIGDMMIFDWFREYPNLGDPDELGWIADDMIQTMMHIYMSVSNALLSAIGPQDGTEPIKMKSEEINCLLNIGLDPGTYADEPALTETDSASLYDRAYAMLVDDLKTSGILIVQSYPQGKNRHLLMLGFPNLTLRAALQLIQHIVESIPGLKGEVMKAPGCVDQNPYDDLE